MPQTRNYSTGHLSTDRQMFLDKYLAGDGTPTMYKNKFNECNFHLDLQPDAQLNTLLKSQMAGQINSCYDCNNCGTKRTLGSQKDCLATCDFTTTAADKEMPQYNPDAGCLSGCKKPLNVGMAMLAAQEKVSTPCDVSKSLSSAYGVGFKCNSMPDCTASNMLTELESGQTLCEATKHCKLDDAGSCAYDISKLVSGFNTCTGECKKKDDTYKVIDGKACARSHTAKYMCSRPTMEDEMDGDLVVDSTITSKEACTAGQGFWSEMQIPVMGVYSLPDGKTSFECVKPSDDATCATADPSKPRWDADASECAAPVAPAPVAPAPAT
jgi:hypothetical protein